MLTFKDFLPRFMTKSTMPVGSVTPSWWWNHGGSMADFPGMGPNIESAQENSAIAYACIERRAGDLARVPMVVVADKADLSKPLPDNDPVVRLLREPLTGFDGDQMMGLLATLYLLRGEAFVVGDQPVSPKALYPNMDPKDWREAVTQRGVLAGWQYQGATFQASYLPADVMHIRTTNAAKPYRGLAPLQAASLPYRIDVQGDTLQSATLGQGGERSIVWQYDDSKEWTTDQKNELEANLKGRKRGAGQPARDVLIPKLDALDPRFTQADLDVLAHQGMAAKKITYAYKVPMFLLGDAAAPNYATAKLLVEEYWRAVILSDLTKFEAAFNRFLRSSFPGKKAVVAFDRSKIASLQADMLQQANIANLLAGMHVPMTEINRRLELGLDDDALIAGDDALVSSTLAPMRQLIEDWRNPPPPPAAPATPPAPAPTAMPGDKAWHGLTQKEIRRRAKSPSAIIARNRRMARLERSLKSDWKSLLASYKTRAGQIVDRELEHQTDASRAAAGLSARLKAELLDDLKADIDKTIPPYHVKAASEGVLAIQELLTGKEWSQEDRDHFNKTPAFNPAAQAAVRRRRNFVAQIADDLFDGIADFLTSAVNNGAEVAELGAVVMHRLNVSSNRAATIARTEIGTAYNVARFTETREQGFQKHEWMTNQDELVRDGDGEEFDHAICDGEVRTIGESFPCGLTYPQEESGEAGNVINCRCECIPVVEEDRPFTGDEE